MNDPTIEPWQLGYRVAMARLVRLDEHFDHATIDPETIDVELSFSKGGGCGTCGFDDASIDLMVSLYCPTCSDVKQNWTYDMAWLDVVNTF